MEKTSFFRVTILANPEGLPHTRNPTFTFSRDDKKKMYDFIDVIVEQGEDVLIELGSDEDQD